MNIVVIGAGGVGGYFGGKIAKAGYKVTFVARGKTFDAIKDQGLVVKSIKGDFKVHPEVIKSIYDIKNPDLIILGVKSWQVIDIAEQLKLVIHKETMVLPLQNGVDNADKLRAILNDENVLAGLCKIVSKIEAPGIIDHFGFEPEIVFGEYDNTQSQRLKDIKMIFDKADFKNAISEDIQLDIWKKFLFIATISGIGALTRSAFGVMREDDNIRQIIYQTANEIVAIANAKSVDLNNHHVEMVLKVIDNLDYDTTASMQRDIMEGRPSELETFNGYINKMGRELHINTPANSFTYHSLLPMEKRARGLI